MDVVAMLDRFEELRDGSGGHTDVLVGLLGWLEHREHLDRLIGGLPVAKQSPTGPNSSSCNGNR